MSSIQSPSQAERKAALKAAIAQKQQQISINEEEEREIELLQIENDAMDARLMLASISIDHPIVDPPIVVESVVVVVVAPSAASAVINNDQAVVVYDHSTSSASTSDSSTSAPIEIESSAFTFDSIFDSAIAKMEQLVSSPALNDALDVNIDHDNLTPSQAIVFETRSNSRQGKQLVREW